MPNYKQRLQRQRDHTTTELEQIYEQSLGFQRAQSRVSLIAACFTFLFFMSGGILVYIGYTPIGVISALSGSLPGVLTYLFFKQLAEANLRVDNMRKELLKEHEALREERSSKETWNQIKEALSDISDEKQKDQIRSIIILQKLGIATDQEIFTQVIPNSREKSAKSPPSD